MQVNDLAKWIDELQGNISVIKQQLAALSGSASDAPEFDIDNPEDGQTLLYDGSDGVWRNYGFEPGGYSETDLYTFSESTSVIELSEAYTNFKMISIRAAYTGAGSVPQYLVYTMPVSALDSGSSYGITSGTAYVWFNVTDADTFTITQSANYRIENVIGINY